MAVTPTSLKARFPEFAAVSNAVAQEAIDEASRHVDSTWQARDVDNAITFLAAHYLAMDGYLVGTGGPSTTAGPIQSEKLGDASVTYGAYGGGSGMTMSGYLSTTYGQRYVRLLRLNHPAVLVV